MNIIIDFILLGALAAAFIVVFRVLTARMPDNTAYKYALGLALATAFFLFYANGAVGLIGAASNDANKMYGGVLAVGFIGALIARFQPRGMARALFATALAQVLVAAIALIAGLGYPASSPLEILILNGFFAALFVGSALLFRGAARERNRPGVEPTA